MFLFGHCLGAASNLVVCAAANKNIEVLDVDAGRIVRVIARAHSKPARAPPPPATPGRLGPSHIGVSRASHRSTRHF